jgi:hypothetical protein
MVRVKGLITTMAVTSLLLGKHDDRSTVGFEDKEVAFREYPESCKGRSWRLT